MKPDHIKGEHWKPMCVITEDLDCEATDNVIKAFEHMGYSVYGGAAIIGGTTYIHNLYTESKSFIDNIDKDGDFFCETGTTKYIHRDNLLSYQELMDIAYVERVEEKEDTPVDLDTDVTITFSVKSLIKNMLIIGMSNGGTSGGYLSITRKLGEFGYDIADIYRWVMANVGDNPKSRLNFNSYEEGLFAYIESSMQNNKELKKLKKQREELDRKISELEGGV